MVMGGATPVVSPGPATPAEEKVEHAAPGKKDAETEEDLLGDEVMAKKSVLKDESFWGELGGFLRERLGSGAVEKPEDVLKAFRDAWSGR